MPQLAEKKKCTGCTACASICPQNCLTMEPDEDGFAGPVLTAPDVCVNCRLCEQVCPVLQRAPVLPKPNALAAMSRDDAVRRSSSSGGVFTELARAVLGKGGVVFGAAYDDSFRVVHMCADTEEGIAALRGAKYAQSDLKGIFPQVRERLERGQWVLFTGTPCQVGGLRSYLRRDYEKLLCVDFVCHGVPSPLAWKRYVELLTLDGPLKSIDLRCKETGWSRYRYSNTFLYQNGTKKQIPSGSSLYMRLFVGDHINRPSCQNCSFKRTGRISDMTLGDFWGIWEIAPEMDDDRGTSLVLVQTEKGRQLLEQIRDRLVVQEVSLADAVRYNPSALFSSPAGPLRKPVMELVRSGRIDVCAELLGRYRPDPLQRVFRKVGKILQLLRRKR